MYKRNKMNVIIAISVVMAFVTPVAAFANVLAIGVTFNVENTDNVETMVESTNSDNIEDTDGNTIYVDDDADPSWYNETRVKTIAEGIINATAGDTVYVYDGTYYEHVTVTKQLNLVGESKENAIIDGSGDGNVIYVTVDRVSIDTFTIRNGKYGIRLDFTLYNNITNCNSYNNQYGIHLEGSAYNNIMNCTFSNSADGIRFIWHSSYNNIINCTSYNNQCGILSIFSLCNDLTNCDLYNNSDYGIHIIRSPDWKLRSNSIYNNLYNFYIEGYFTDNFNYDIDPSNTINGKPIYYLVEQSDIVLDETNNFGFLGLISCTNITVKNSDAEGILLVNTTNSRISNVSSHNSGNGVHLFKSLNNNIENCISYDNSDAGIYFFESLNNNITNCNSYNNEYGVFLSDGSSYNNIANCTTSYNTRGIYLDYASSDNNIINCDSYNSTLAGIILGECLNCNIINCNTYNNQYGIVLTDECLDNNIMNCNSYGNQYGIYLTESLNNNIMNCTLYKNEMYGIRLYGCCDDNLIHHNNFVNNGQNADEWYCGLNNWDDGTEGNYWDDYTGVDGDGDGIGDTPYNITGGSNKDRFPLMCPLEDETPPIITDIAATPEVQKPEEPVNITCTVTDNWDLVDTVKIYITDPYGFTLGATMNEGSYYYEDIYTTMGVYYYYIWANDSQGNIAFSDTYTFVIIDIDTSMSAVDPLPTWETAVPFTVTATAYDNICVASVTLYSRYSENGTDWTDWASYGIDEEASWSWSFTGSDGYYEFYSIAVDDFGNVEEPPDIADASNGIDTTDPVTINTLSGTMSEDEWYVSDVVVTLSSTDDASGVESTWYSLDYGYWKLYVSSFMVRGDGHHTVEYCSFDRAGNKEDTKSADFKIDKTLPVTDHEFDGIIGDDGWFVSDVTVTLSATDAMSGINYIMYKIDDDNWIIYAYPFVVTENGEYTIGYYSVDRVGNKEEDKGPFAFKIDQTDPIIELIWGDDNSKLVADVYDETSGVARVEFYLNDELLGEITDDPYEWEITNPRTGDTAQAIVYDYAGNDAVSALIEAVPQNQSQQSSSSTSVPWMFSRVLCIW